MTKSRARAFVSALLLVVCSPVLVSAQQPEIPRKLPRLAIALKVSSLGAGVELAIPVLQHSNFRTGFNMFVYDHDFSNDGTDYNAQFNLRSLQTNYDWFPFGGSFHVSPGVLLFNGNRAAAKISTPVAFGNDSSGTATGDAKIEFRRFAPVFLLGWGNLLPRHGRRHFSIPFEFGVAYHGSPKIFLRMDSIGCHPGDAVCMSASADSAVLNGFQAQQTEIRRQVARFRLYPVVSVGFGYSF